MKKLMQSWILRIIIGVVVCVLGTFILKKYIIHPVLSVLLGSEKWRDGIQYVMSSLVIIGFYYMIYRLIEKRKIHELALDKIGKDLLVGLIAGSGLISLCVFLLYLFGYFEVHGFNSFSVILLPLAFLMSAALLEEVVFRGIIYRILEERFGTNIALFQALIFGFVHFGNINATITSVWFVVILGVVLSLMYTYTRRLWLPFFFHLSWNFTQIVYGTPLSGHTNFKSLLSSKFNGPGFFIGSEFGLEDSFFSILFMTVLAIYLYYTCEKKRS